jgi:hypothetical protein
MHATSAAEAAILLNMAILKFFDVDCSTRTSARCQMAVVDMKGGFAVEDQRPVLHTGNETRLTLDAALTCSGDDARI